MGELRKDYILDRWVVVSPKRGQRPHELKKPPLVDTGVCYFCPGNESTTPPEIGRVVKNGGWQLRWFENKFAALKPEGDFAFQNNRFYSFSGAYGYHEVLVETPRHDLQLSQLGVEEIEQVLNIYARRVLELESKPGIAYVNVFKNHGLYGGTSLVHSHSQIMALAFVPPEIKDKICAMHRFVSCPYCSVIESEKNSGRLCFENSDFVAFCPYASRFNYEVWIFPKQHIARLEQLNLSSLANILVSVLKKVHEGGFDYNMLVQYGPKGEDFHFHIEICPRIAVWAGFELCSGVIINSVAPEDAAKFYRGEE